MYSILMINTYNESSLHKNLKMIFAMETKGLTEVKIDSYYCDVVGNNNQIIEIQTKNFNNIKTKLQTLLQEHLVKLVYPLAIESYIEYYDKNNTLISRRKSPIKKNMYNIFDELMYIPYLLLHKNFEFEVIETIIVKERLRTEFPVQVKTKRRRRLQNWLSQNIRLEYIGKRTIFTKKTDYLNLLPQTSPTKFTVKDVNDIIGHKSSKMIWTLAHCGLITCIKIKGRTKVYIRK